MPFSKFLSSSSVSHNFEADSFTMLSELSVPAQWLLLGQPPYLLQRSFSFSTEMHSWQVYSIHKRHLSQLPWVHRQIQLSSLRALIFLSSFHQKLQRGFVIRRHRLRLSLAWRLPLPWFLFPSISSLLQSASCQLDLCLVIRLLSLRFLLSFLLLLQQLFSLQPLWIFGLWLRLCPL